MTAPASRSVSYLPGRWSALVTDTLALLADVPLADPALAACWDAAGAGDVAGLLEVLGRPGPQGSPSFVVVARENGGLRLVVAGRAHAEVFSGAADPVVHAGQGTPTDVTLDAAQDVRLVADDPTPFERISPLPLVSGIVLASYVFSTAAPMPPPAAEPGADAVGWIPPPLSPVPSPSPSSEQAAGPHVFAEPAPAESGVFRALPWRTSLIEGDDAAPPADAAAADDAIDDTDTDAVDVPDAAATPSFPDPPTAAEPPPLPAAGLDPVPEPPAWGSWEAPDYPAPDYPAPDYPAPGYPPPDYPAPEPGPADLVPPVPAGYAYPPPPPPPPSEPPAAPQVQAVLCSNGHPNPLHLEACRVCGAGFASQQPVTIERPSLGVLRLSTGAEIPLDRDALLGRAPFAVDQRSVRLVEVPSPNNDISRSHVRITLDGWQVLATDLGSTNGTAVTLPGEPTTFLHPHDPLVLSPGAVLALADEAEARFDVL